MSEIGQQPPPAPSAIKAWSDGYDRGYRQANRDLWLLRGVWFSVGVCIGFMIGGLFFS